MTQQRAGQAREAIAADWVARQDRRALTAEESVQLEAWLDSDPRCRGAYVRAQAAWTMLDRARALPELSASAGCGFRWTRRAAVGGGLAAAAAGVAALLLPRRSPVDRYATAIGEIHRVGLVDGSSLVLNTQSELEVQIGDRERRIWLQKGEAWFDVAKDRTRPFVVDADLVQVRAVGTAFAVHRLPEGGVRVTVSEGMVEIVGAGRGEMVRLPAGAIFERHNAAEPPALRRLSAGEVEGTLAWREGMLSLAGEKVASAVREFNRYNQLKLVVDDPDLAEEKLIGYFRLSDPRGFAAAVAQTLGAGFAEQEGNLVLRRAKTTP